MIGAATARWIPSLDSVSGYGAAQTDQICVRRLADPQGALSRRAHEREQLEDLFRTDHLTAQSQCPYVAPPTVGDARAASCARCR